MGGISFKEKAGGVFEKTDNTEVLDMDMACRVWAAGTFVTVNNASQPRTIPGVLATDFAIALVSVIGSGSRYVLAAVCAADTLTITMSGAPGTDTTVAYAIFRPL